MTTLSFPLSSTVAAHQVSAAVNEGLLSSPKTLPAWLFYDDTGSRLFDRITELPEYYLTRTERAIFSANAAEIIALSAESHALQIVELGAGSCDKTRILLQAAAERQDTVLYEPIDVSPAPLEEASDRLEREIPGVLVSPRVQDYTRSLTLDPPLSGERRLVLYIGSSIGNFDPAEAHALLAQVRATLAPGDSFLLGVDLVKEEALLHAAYNDEACVTEAFNRNILHRLNRELGANFKPELFAHRALWNPQRSRIEMHLESLLRQIVTIPGPHRDAGTGEDVQIEFSRGETIHTENSYKYRPGQAEAMLESIGFTPLQTWTDKRGWFAVSLARVA
jgi:L-histidine N-alpha-methyltransferase